MCGIAGILHFDNSRIANQNTLKSMIDAIDYRGPDNEGIFIDKNVGLGHKRLSIIDISDGSQPMFSSCKNIVLVFNGAIYNYLELRLELEDKGYTFNTKSDTEVIINSYKEWGYECQNKFNGMWSFALWDDKVKKIFISRDRIGEKPLHYSLYDNSVIFGSEIKSIFKYGISKKPDFRLLELYVVFKSIPAPYTFYKNIKKLMPGHYLLIDKYGAKEIKYWDLPSIDEDNLIKDKEYVYKKFTQLLNDSIKIRMRSDVSYGAFLSGGLDSSSIVALMSKISTHPIKTFTIGYDENEFDESKLAQLVSDKFKTDHFLGKVTEDSFEKTLNKIVFHCDEPFGDSSAIPTGYVSKFASKSVKMVLTGDGGDELLSGYPTYQTIEFLKLYKKIPKIVRFSLLSSIKLLNKFSNQSLRYKLNRYINLLNISSENFNDRILSSRAKPSLTSIKDLINDDIDLLSCEDYLSEIFKGCSYKDEFYKLMYFNYKFDLPNDYLVKVDRMSMAYSIETRLPFLDYRLIEFMAKVDKTVKLQKWELKSILKKTIGKNLPLKLMKAPKKGFRVPVREWFKSKELNKILYNSVSKNKFINKNKLKQIINENETGEYDHGNLLWSLIVLDKSIN